MSVALEVQGLRELQTKLRSMGAAGRKVARRAVEQAATLQLQAVRSNLRASRTGLLKKSLGKVVKTYGTGTVVSLVGPRHGFWVTARRIEQKGRRRTLIATRGLGAKQKTIKLRAGTGVNVLRKGGTKRLSINPVFYAHLVEGGSRARRTRGGANRGAMPAWPFVGPAARSTRQASLDAIGSYIAKNIARGDQ
jgi:hypothetical protein